MCKRILLLLVICALTTRAAEAPPTEASIKELLALTQVNKLLDAMLPQLENTIRNGVREALKGQEISPEVQARIDKSRSDGMATLRSELAWSRLEPIYVRIYQKSFTQQEIDGMLAFYRTNLGQTMVLKLPTVLQSAMVEIETTLTPMLQNLQRSQQSLVTQIQADARAKK